jgi:hypothetical protein
MDRMYRFHAWMAVISVTVGAGPPPEQAGLGGVHTAAGVDCSDPVSFGGAVRTDLFIDTRLRSLKFIRELVHLYATETGVDASTVWCCFTT